MNRCENCRVLKITTCPILDKAYERYNWDYLETCEMADVAQKIWMLGKKVGANAPAQAKQVAYDYAG